MEKVIAREDAPNSYQAWNALFDALLLEQVELAGRITDAIQTQLPAYRVVPRNELDHEVGLEIEQVLRSQRAGRPAMSEGELAELAAIGESRAQQGVAVEEMLRAWRIGIEVAVDYARQASRRLDIADTHVLEFVQSALAWSDMAMTEIAGAHRRTALTLVPTEEQHRAAFVRDALLGTAPPDALRIQAEAYGLEPTAEYVAIRARLDEGVSRQKLERVLGFHDGMPHRRGLSAILSESIVGFARQSPPQDVDAVAGVGPPRPLERLAESYRLAARALLTTQACGFRGAYDLPSFGLRAAVAADADVGEPLRKRYLEPLAESGSSHELMATLRAYLACGMHVERTATRLFVHPNTVRYRLTRVEELTGASLRDTRELFELWWAVELAAMRL